MGSPADVYHHVCEDEYDMATIIESNVGGDVLLGGTTISQRARHCC